MKSYDLKLTGRSGCELEIISQNKTFIVRKSSKNLVYNHRLLLQAEKQKDFKKYLNFYAPRVFTIVSEQQFASFEMEYIVGEKYSEYFVRLTKNEIDVVIDNFLAYLQHHLSESELQPAPSQIFFDKATQLKKQLANEEGYITELLDKLIEKIPESPLPVGYCHGDLTFSNMVFTQSKIYFIDFLDSFINSPIIDVVKLRQDTKYYWTLLIDEELPDYTKNKMLQIMAYLDGKIDNFCARHNFFYGWYDYLQVFNLLRILPYTTNQKERELIVNALKTINI